MPMQNNNINYISLKSDTINKDKSWLVETNSLKVLVGKHRGNLHL